MYITLALLILSMIGWIGSIYINYSNRKMVGDYLNNFIQREDL